MPIHGYPGNVITANPTAPTVSSASGVWTTEQQLQAIAAGNWPGYEYPISRSLRFNSADSAYLNRTFTTPTNNKIYTWNQWVKRGQLTASTLYVLASCPTAGFLSFGDGTNQVIRWNDGTADLISTPLYRDPSAWYMITVAVDTTQATSSDRVKIYVNGIQVTAFSTAGYPSLNASQNWNSAGVHNIGRRVSTSTLYYDGYLTEINFIDGQALTPSSFGLNDPETGVWSPKQYTGTYGTNGFYLNFSDNSGTTSTTLGKDSSGNGNNWTPNNFSVTAGEGNDSMVDTPTAYGTDTGVGGEVRGNYTTWNPIYTIPSNTTTSFTNGNLDFSVTQAEGTGTASAVTTMPLPTTGKWYWEVTPSAVATTATRTHIGVMAQSQINYAMANGSSGTPGSTGQCFAYSANGQKVNDATYTNYGNSYTANDVIGIAVDLDNNAIYFSKNGTWQNSGDPTSGSSKTGAAYTTLSGSNNYFPGIGYWIRASINFGQRAFAYTAPSGFKALCTQNLPTPTIGATSTTQANKYFNAVTYAGAGAGTVITTGFYPDFAWMKNRTAAFSNFVQDSVRGGGVYLLTDTTDADAAVSPSSTFSSTGITINANSSYASNSSYNYVAWAWKANAGSTVTNTAGTITSTVSANTTAGFSIVTYTGNGSSGATIGHGLGVAPSMFIVKSRGTTDSWGVYHVSLGNTKGLYLETTGAAVTSSAFWNNTSPTSTVFSVSNNSINNASSTNYVAYCFAPVAGYSAFGSYTGNGSTDGPFVYLGFRPRFLLLKISSTTGNWAIYDTSRNTYNVMDLYLYPNSSAAEGGSGTPRVDALSNGFKLRNSGQDNTSSATYIYAAFAESPFKYSLAR